MYKVLFLGWEYYPVFTGGLGIVCKAMAEEMAEQGLEVYVAVPQVPKKVSVSKVSFTELKHKTKTHKSESNISKNITKYTTNVELNPYSSTNLVSRSDESYQEVYEWIRTLNKDLKKIENIYGDDLFEKVGTYTELIKDLVIDLEFDVIHAHDWMTFIAAIESKKLTGKKCVLHVHATEHDRTAGNPHELIANIEKDMMHKSDLVLTISEHTKSVLTDKYELEHKKIKVVHHALDESHYTNPDRDIHLGNGKTVLFLGRAVVQKGVYHFIEIASKVLRFLPETNFIFAGSGDQYFEAIDRVNELGLHQNFYFTGSVDREEGDLLFHNADLYLMTSVSEPFGITALESVRVGTPVIVTKTSGVGEVIHSAPKVDFWDVDKFADYVINMLSNEELYEEMKNAQIKEYDNLSWKSQVSQIIDIYHTLLN